MRVLIDGISTQVHELVNAYTKDVMTYSGTREGIIFTPIKGKQFFAEVYGEKADALLEELNTKGYIRLEGCFMRYLDELESK